MAFTYDVGCVLDYDVSCDQHQRFRAMFTKERRVQMIHRRVTIVDIVTKADALDLECHRMEMPMLWCVRRLDSNVRLINEDVGVTPYVCDINVFISGKTTLKPDRPCEVG